MGSGMGLLDVNLLDRTPPKADKRISYGADPLQFGDLWMPAVAAGTRVPVLVFVHGGWWQSAYGLEYAGFLCQAMKALGVAVWSVEYRRVGNSGGGWPGTMQDVAAGTDYVAELAKTFAIDAERVVAAGHSAGGQLAFWLAGRHHIPHDSVLAQPEPKIVPRGLVALAGAVDLRLTIELCNGGRFTNGRPSTIALMGGTPDEFPARYAAANPGELLPLMVAQKLVQGTADGQIPAELPQRWKQMAQRQGDAVEVTMVEGASHFDVVDPESEAWPASRDAMVK
jgi:acetyl esterase/lipase